MQGYYRYPTVHQDQVVFVCEDDLWQVSLKGGLARRLTSGKGAASFCHYAPDGQHIAYSSTEEGAMEVYVMPSQGGQAKQLTFDGGRAHVVGWSADHSEIYFSSDRHAHARQHELFAVSVHGGDPRSLNVGQGVWFHENTPNNRVLGRHSQELAYWKRYQGGLAATIWVQTNDTWHELLPDTRSGKTRPMWLNDRIWFTSDMEGHGNLYSCTADGDDLTRHTDHEGFYVRFATTDGKQIVYACGADLYAFDVQTKATTKIDIEHHSPRTQLNRKFVSARHYLEEYSLHPSGHSFALAARGKAFNMALWEGAVRQTGEEQGVRYDIPRYLSDGKRVLYVSDEGGEEHLEIHDTRGLELPKKVDTGDVSLGRPLDVKVNPNEDINTIALINHRYELMLVNLETGEGRVIDLSLIHI